MQNTGPDILTSKKHVHVAVAVIYGDDGRILVARRPEDKHQGGLWEFPGGKVEPGETIQKALQRELQEELAIQVSEFKPLIRVRHDYPDTSVLLDTWEVSGISGKPRGNEGQAIQWVDISQLQTLQFPKANQSIIQAIQLPDHYMVTGWFEDTAELFSKVRMQCSKGIRLVQFRALWLSQEQYLTVASELSVLVKEFGGRLMLKGVPNLLKNPWCAGLHLTSEQLMSGEGLKKYHDNQWIVASCHNRAELSQAEKIGADFVTLSPVKKTKSHPDTAPLGFNSAAQLTESTSLPVYWLGGLTITDISRVKPSGAQGVAAISEFWN
ncbi:hypothetical protein ACH42_14460 [Endozoicomonas sp. (ex Bugula neritina AB1)]|nr:hypothetical protein ACH42_14460 [Endozoicomonas sp. (ex Bugula neritina AB1)]